MDMADTYCGHCGDETESLWKCASCDIMKYCSAECEQEDR